jgi:hypothetical protein
VVLRGIQINYQDDSNAYNITVIFKIKEFDTNESVEIVLRRLR